VTPSFSRDIANLPRLRIPELRDRYRSIFGEMTTANNKSWLVRRIAWRLQAEAEGGLSERALKRAAELAREADLRLMPPKTIATADDQSVLPSADPRLPPPGTILTRMYKRQTIQVLIRPDGFEWEGKIFSSLSAVANTITGSHVNGYRFFHIPVRATT
jgi:hypothetical protein